MEQPAKRARIAETASSQDIRHSATHPKFLHSNSTSHQWVFGAIAELIDNAVDPDVAAKRIYIDVYPLRAGPTIGNEEQEGGGELSLMIIDDGNGMDHEGLHKLLCERACSRHASTVVMRHVRLLV
jgi:nitrogen fixation/metabolism regulation signal transduction histidine kinase